jgi:hypothetical protein
VQRRRLVTLCALSATIGVSFHGLIALRNGFFSRDIGPVTGIAEGARGISPTSAPSPPEVPGEVAPKDPDTGKLATFPSNNGRLFITLKPRNETTPRQGGREWGGK